MKISIKEVEHIAELSRLNFSEEEKEQMRGFFADILSSFQTLDKVDISSAEASSGVMEKVNVLREDTAFQELSRAQLLENAPDSDGEYYIVPRVLD